MGNAETQTADKKRGRTVTVLAAGAVICALVTGYLLLDYHRTSVEAERALETLRFEGEAVSGEAPKTGRAAEPAVEAVVRASSIPDPPTVPDPYTEVFREYPDIKGWLHVDGTSIDYPILQREGDDEYYLYRDFRGEEDKRESLILDEDSSVGGGRTLPTSWSMVIT